MTKATPKYADDTVYQISVNKVVTLAREKIRPGMTVKIKGRMINADAALLAAISESFPVG
jgi:hypothetical protein